MDVLGHGASIKGSAENFTGDVWRNPITGERSRVQVNLVRFMPGARTAWHTHANGQTLHVVDGRGYVQALGNPALDLRSGDTVYAPPGEVHWHGAAEDAVMAHLSISERLAEGQQGPETDWQQHVTDDEYSQARSDTE